MHKVRRVGVLATAALGAALLLSSSAPASAGTTGVIHGFVYHRHDLSGSHALVPAPYVIVRLIANDEVVIATTDKHGFFSFVSVTPGFYELLPYVYGPGCFPLARASADQVTSVRLIMYMESVHLDCRFPQTIVDPD